MAQTTTLHTLVRKYRAKIYVTTPGPENQWQRDAYREVISVIETSSFTILDRSTVLESTLPKFEQKMRYLEIALVSGRGNTRVQRKTLGIYQTGLSEIKAVLDRSGEVTGWSRSPLNWVQKWFSRPEPTTSFLTQPID